MVGKRTLTKLAALFMAGALALSMTACSGGTAATKTSETTAAKAAAKKVKIGLTMISLSDAVIAAEIEMAKAKAAELGAELLINDANADPNAQVSAVENFIEAKCDVIIIQPVDAASISATTKKAMDAGIKVVDYCIPFENNDCFFKIDNTAVGNAIGMMAADWIKKNAGGKAKIGLIEFPMVPLLIERAEAIKATLAKEVPDSTIVASGSGIDTEGGMKLGETFLQKDPDIQVIVGISDGPCLGAYEAVKTAGLDNDKFAIFGSDLSPVALPLIKAGTAYRGSVDTDSLTIGNTIIETAVKIANGESVEKTIVISTTQVTADNVDKYIKK